MNEQHRSAFHDRQMINHINDLSRLERMERSNYIRLNPAALWPIEATRLRAEITPLRHSAPCHVTLDFETDDAMLDAIRHGAGISSRPIQTIDLKIQPKKTTMNEIFDSLEAMIRRIVKEEIAVAPVVVDDRDFDRGFERYVDNNSGKWTALVKQGVGVPAPMPMPASWGVLDSAAFAAQLKNFAQLRPVEFALLVKDATLDQGWFDDAITAQVVAAGDVSSQEDFEAKFKRMADGTEIVFRAMRDAVEGDWFTEHMQDILIGSDALDDRITKVVSNMSIVA